MNKIPESINVLKKIKLKENDIIEVINEKIKNNFCVDSSDANIEVIIFLCSSTKKNNIERLFYDNNFALYLPVIIEVNKKTKINQIVNKLKDRSDDITEQTKNFIKDYIDINNIKLNHDLISSYLDVLNEFKSFFNRIHKNCGKKICKIKNIKSTYYKNLPSEDVKNILANIKSINNIFGFFSLLDKDKFISSLEDAFKFNIINTVIIISDQKSTLLNYTFDQGNIVDYTLKINEYNKLLDEEKKIIIETILSKKLIRIE